MALKHTVRKWHSVLAHWNSKGVNFISKPEKLPQENGHSLPQGCASLRCGLKTPAAWRGGGGGRKSADPAIRSSARSLHCDKLYKQFLRTCNLRFTISKTGQMEWPRSTPPPLLPMYLAVPMFSVIPQLTELGKGVCPTWQPKPSLGFLLGILVSLPRWK